MIKRNDLRFNNWVYGSVISAPLQIRSINRTICQAGDYLEDYESVHPIPLTPEILEKAGFKYGIIKGIVTIGDSCSKTEETGDTEYWDKGRITIVRWNKKEFILSNKSSFDHRIELKSLHQLQNITYWLTGQELEFTP